MRLVAVVWNTMVSALVLHQHRRVSLLQSSSVSQAIRRFASWRDVDWQAVEQQPMLCNPPSPSPVETVAIHDRLVHFKRDDLLQLPGSLISGNKARKFWTLQAAVMSSETIVCSHGGAQSNAMVALAAIANHRNWRFVYYTKPLGRFLREQQQQLPSSSSSSSNLQRALSLGMELKEVSNYKEVFDNNYNLSIPPAGLPPPGDDDGNHSSIWIPQGGAACGVARAGAKHLAHEIVEYWQQQKKRNSLPLSIILPGGTCTTAVLLNEALQTLLALPEYQQLDVTVTVVPCVGDAVYATRQMKGTTLSLSSSLPHVLAPSINGRSSYFAFARPDPEILSAHNSIQEQTGIPLDLLYGSPTWAILLRHWKHLYPSRQLMYVHSGGYFEGNDTQLKRYQFKRLTT